MCIKSPYSCKIVEVFPARRFVKCNENSINVDYIHTHSHSVDFQQTKYLPLPPSIRDDIYRKQSLNVPIETILDNLRENIGNLNTRDNEDIEFFQLINRKKHPTNEKTN